MAYQTSQGLASLGRNGDSVLVHMNPTEVAGLQSLAMAQGGSLTINPDTGLPEAFSLGGFFKSLLPVFVGAATGGAGMPLWAGIAAGAATGAVTNKDHLMGAITGGLGGYGGFGLGQGLAAAGAPSAIPGAAGSSGIVGSTGEMGSSLLNASRGIAPGAASATANAAGNAYNLADTAVNTSGLSAGNVNPALANLKNVANTSGFTASAGSGATGIDKSFLGGMDRLGPGINQMGTGIKNIATSQPGAWDAFKGSFVEPGAKPISDLAAYGKIGMPVGGAALGGLEPSDIYGEPIDMAAAKEKEKYDPNRSLNLSGDTGLRLYAMGGPIQATAGSGVYGNPDGTIAQQTPKDDYGIGRLSNLASAQEMQQAKTLGYAMGGPVSFADGGDTNLNVDSQPTLNLNSMQPDYNYSNDLKMDPNNNPPAVNNFMIMLIKKAIAEGKLTNPNKSSLDGIKALNTNTVPSLNTGVPAPVNMNNINTANLYNKPTQMARGGYLDGAGDGMSDSIPATIEGKQPARLADGEFVVPADVVSHIGNGSSKAGSQRLYSMLDKVRKARTGHVKQGKQINPNKYLPA